MGTVSVYCRSENEFETNVWAVRQEPPDHAEVPVGGALFKMIKIMFFLCVYFALIGCPGDTSVWFRQAFFGYAVLVTLRYGFVKHFSG